MATLNSQNPSSSSSSHPENKFRYDIFLSFRGSDTRKKFTDHLYHALMHEGFQTFRGGDEIERGDHIKSELLEAIRDSKMSIVVLSENYANSTACLFELQTILELCKESRHFVLPVFYEVEPSLLKEQSKKLVFENEEVTDEKVKGWGVALKEVARMAGMVFRKDSDGYEAKFIEEIVAKLKTKIVGKHMSVCDHPVGMESRTKPVNSWLKDSSNRVAVLLICGMGGIGKTVIAKDVFNSNYCRYDAACFLLNISEVAKQHGLVRLQRQLLSDILGKKQDKVNNVDDGCRRMSYALRNKRVLLVLDDVDQMDQLFALVGQTDWFSDGSKIIMTTRLESVMNAHASYRVYKPKKLFHDESLELFSWHAFGQKHPIQGLMDLSEKFVKHCDGLPLALKVLGSSIWRKSIDIWESELQKLETTSCNTILKKLEISYDSLDDHDKNIFLDVACFFAGKKKNGTLTILEGCGYSALAGVHNLVDRNLLAIENEKLEMHRLLQDMGKQIVRRESKFPGKRSRIWRHEESSNILQEKIGTDTIEGLVLDMSMLRKPNKFVFEANAFENMYNLRLLKLSGVKLSGTCKAFPKRLRWLYWHGFPLESFPNDFPLENLVSLEMRHSNLKQVWKGTMVLGSLRNLNLSYSTKLTSVANFSRFPNLEKLVLKECSNLFEVNESIVKLQKIKLINLKGCKNLRKLPKNIGMLESLVEIDVSGCSNLMGAIEELEKMKSLQVLRAIRMDTDRFFSVEVVSQASIWPWVPKPRVQKSFASLPFSLVHLNISRCNLIADAFPRELGNLSKLQRLYMGGNPVSSLPNFIKDLTNLQTLDFSNCRMLQRIHLCSTSLKDLYCFNCEALKKVTNETGTRIPRILYSCSPNLNQVDRYFKMLPVREVDAELINGIGFAYLDSMANLKAKLLNFKTGCLPKFPIPIQIVHEEASNLFYTFFPGREVPYWFSNKKSGSTISFTATLFPHFAFGGLNLCAVYTLPEDGNYFKSRLNIEINNKSSGMNTLFYFKIHGVPEKGGDHMVWLSHCIEADLFTEGDEVEVSFIITHGQVEDCGVHLLYFEDEGEKFKYINTIQRLIDPNLSPDEPEAGVKEGKKEPYFKYEDVIFHPVFVHPNVVHPKDHKESLRSS